MIEDHQKFKVTQTLALFNKNDEVLIMEHEIGKWLLLGGRLNKDEGWEEGLRREVKEESGIEDFEIKGIIKVDNWISHDVNHYGVFFVGRTSTVEVDPSNEMMNYAWVKPGNLDEYDMWVDDLKNTIKKAEEFIKEN